MLEVLRDGGEDAAAGIKSQCLNSGKALGQFLIKLKPRLSLVFYSHPTPPPAGVRQELAQYR